MAFHIKIGNYRFSKNLGTGSFGKVKLAYHEITGHKVAVKILNKKKIKQQGVFEKVKREIKVLRQFNHPHIIKHYEFIDTPSDIFMVIEFASGGELFDLISRRNRLSEVEARRFFQQIYSSIEYTHAHKIAHRDLKPENILLDEYNNIKLIDFGLANSMKDSQALKTACGSPNYAAPEVISGRSYGGVEVDVWSLGVILFAMVCGSFPFDDESMSSLFAKIKESKYFMPNYISADVQDLINRMLQPNPVKRISMREIKEHPWYLKDLPQYLQDLSLMHSKPTVIDMDIVKKLFTLNINLGGRTEEEVIKAIKDKKNTEFCGIYELYYNDKLKKECFKTQQPAYENDDPYSSNPMFTNSQMSSASSCKENCNQTKHFRTLRHLLMHCDEEQQSKGQSSSNTSQSIHSNSHYSLQNQEAISHYSLLSVKHTERLHKVVKKFRNGDIAQKKPLRKTSSFSRKLSPQVNYEAAGPSGISSISTRIETATVSQNTSQFAKLLSQSKVIKQHDTQQHQISRPLAHPYKGHHQWVCGLIFKGTPIELLTLTCEILRQLDIEWQIIPKDLKMKCRSRIDENSVMDYESSLLMDAGEHPGDDPLANSNKDELIKEFLRKNFLKFYINIYKDPTQENHSSSRSSMMGSGGGTGNLIGAAGSGALSTGHHALDEHQSHRYMIDIHLFKGTLYVFMDFMCQFIHLMTSFCTLCYNNSSCSSSNQSSVMDGKSNSSRLNGNLVLPNGHNNNKGKLISKYHAHNYKLKIFN